jgi:hypothetical protein
MSYILLYVCFKVRACTFVRVCICVELGAGPKALACACACVALLIQHATHRHIAICGLSSSTIFFDIISKGARFREKGH